MKDRVDCKFKTYKLKNNFSEFKYFGKAICTKDYIFQIDADEMPNEYLIKYIKDVLEANKQIDLFFVPRVNIVNGLTQDLVKKWGWKLSKIKGVDEQVVNFPDYQSRIFKNLPNIQWQGNVHEMIVGHSTQAFLPDEYYWCLNHIKPIEKQIKQNSLYYTQQLKIN